MNLVGFVCVRVVCPITLRIQAILTLFSIDSGNQLFNRNFLRCLSTQALSYSLKIQNHGRHGSLNERIQTLKEI